MTGGNHAQYLDSTTTPFKFSFAKWKAKLNTFNTQAIRAAVDTAVRDTTIPFVTLMDEPDNPSWGPTGTMTHALVDSMSVYSKSIFPTLKTGVAVTWKWEKTTQYPSHSVDLIISQYSFSADTIVQRYVDSAVVSAKRQLVGLMLSMNVLDGGGRTFGSAQMTAAQVKNFGNVLVSAPFSCGLLMWKWDDTFMANAGNKASFDSVAATAARRPAKPCGK
jgi:hypothetical protein